MKKYLSSTSNVNPALTAVIGKSVLYPPKVKGGCINMVQNYKSVVVARSALEKRVGRVVNVLAELPENYHLRMVGGGVLKDRSQEMAEDMGLSPRVRFFGVVGNIQEVMLQHDLMVLSSYTEGFPNVVLEALNIGLPVVTFK